MSIGQNRCRAGRLRYSLGVRGNAVFLVMYAVAAVGFAQQGSPQPASPEATFNRAMQEQQSGDDAAAIRDYQAVLRVLPDKLEVRANLAVALAHEGHYQEAIAEYRRVLAAAPNDPGLLTDLGLAYYKTSDCRDAVREFEAAARVQRADVKIATLLGDCEVRLGQAAAAAAMLLPLEPANSANPDFEFVLGTAMIGSGHRLDGVDRLEAAGAAGHNPEAYLQAGSTLINLNRFTRALTDLKAAFQLNPQLPGIETLLGMANDMNGDAAAAEPELREALQRNPDDFNANLYLGSILYKRRSMGEAKTCLARALQANPSSPTARYEMAMWKSTSGDYAGAAQDLEQLEKADPGWLQPHAELAVVYYRLHRPADGMRERTIVARIKAQQQEAGPAGGQPAPPEGAQP